MNILEKLVESTKRHFPISPKKDILSVVVIYKTGMDQVVNETTPFILAGYKHTSYETDDIVVLCEESVGFTAEDVEFFETCSSTQAIDGEKFDLGGTIHLYKNI